ncbi:hypothetical protein DFP72DRAFT_607734 [Ephemerocybe angulata]|uniref:Uncharacterized protein n=1 Tax=Ephemerocybe angulata TaxID=980116 RepID=A0A8H6HI71_9AGAR|nr:hypothetical protein DFP72DRAFT_607734 [Tulosesus angulatus]
MHRPPAVWISCDEIRARETTATEARGWWRASAMSSRRRRDMLGDDDDLRMSIQAKGRGCGSGLGVGSVVPDAINKDSCGYIHPTESDLSKPLDDDDDDGQAHTLSTSSPRAQTPDDYSSLRTDRGTGEDERQGPVVVVSTWCAARGAWCSPAAEDFDDDDGESMHTVNGDQQAADSGGRRRVGEWGKVRIEAHYLDSIRPRSRLSAVWRAGGRCLRRVSEGCDCSSEFTDRLRGARRASRW